MGDSYRNTLLEVAESIDSALRHIALVSKAVRGDNLDPLEKSGIKGSVSVLESDCAILNGNLLRAVNFINDEWPLIEGNAGRQREVRDFIGKFDAFCNAVMEFDSQCMVNESTAFDVLGDYEASREYVIIASKYCEGLRRVTEDLDTISSGRGKKTTPLQGLAEEMSGYFNGLMDSDLEDALLHNKFIGHKGDWTEHVNKATYFGNHFGVSAEVMNRIFRFHGKDGRPTLAHFTRNPYPIGHKNDKLVEILAKYPRKEK